MRNPYMRAHVQVPLVYVVPVESILGKLSLVRVGDAPGRKSLRSLRRAKKFTQETQSLRKVYAGLRGLRFLTKSLRRKRRFTQETQVNAEGSLLMAVTQR